MWDFFFITFGGAILLQIIFGMSSKDREEMEKWESYADYNEP